MLSRAVYSVDSSDYLPSAYVEFRAVLDRHSKDLACRYPERQSTTWFFLRYVQRVARRAHAQVSPRDCDSAMRGLTRFYLDHIAPDSDLAWRFDEILDAHRKALRSAHSL